MKQHLHIDLETYSNIDLKKSGLHKYCEAVEILLFGYNLNYTITECLDLTKNNYLSRRGQIPSWLFDALTDPNYIKFAQNAPFEIEVIEAYFGITLDRSQWVDVQMLVAMAGLPQSLDGASKALNLIVKKDSMGIVLIRYFCIPCKPTKNNDMRTRNLPKHAPDKWAMFIRYCKQDVNTEIAIVKKLSFIPIDWQEHALWVIDQHINKQGVKVHMGMVTNAIKMDNDYKAILTAEAIKLTGLSNPKSVSQVKRWLEIEEDIEIDNLKKANLPLIIKRCTGEVSRRVIAIRQELSKTSVSKYTAMFKSACNDDRIRGLHQFYGANRTGRWAGRLVQTQNLPRATFSNTKDKKVKQQILDIARESLISNDYETINIIFGAIPDALSKLIRTTFIAEKGHRFIISDYSAIEARVIAWLAGEKWRLDVFNTHGKIYEASAAKILKKDIADVTSEERQKIGKVSELALGYQGGVNAMLAMGAIEAGLESEELQPIVSGWRKESPQIVNLWYAAQKAAIMAIRTGKKIRIYDMMNRGERMVKVDRGVYFSYRNKCLFMHLPSGRALTYYHAHLVQGRYGDAIKYFGVNQKVNKWMKLDTYGGKLVENAVQAIARDCLAFGIKNLYYAGYSTVLHIHDEVVCETPIGYGSQKEVNNLLIKPAAWMKDLPLRAEGFESIYYKKD